MVVRVDGTHRIEGAGVLEGPVGECGDDLVGIHVGGCTRAGLVNIHNKLPIPPPFCDLMRSRGDGLGHGGRKIAEGTIGPRGGLLHCPQRLDQAAPESLTADGKVFDRALGLGTVQGIDRNADLSQGIFLNAI